MAKLIDTVSTAQTVIPEWYTNEAMNLLAEQDAVSKRGYTPYGGERIANLTPDQLSGLDQARLAATGYTGQLGKATGTADNIDYSGFGAANDRFKGIDFSGFGDAARTAGGLGALGAKANSLGAADEYYSRASGMSGTDAADPYLRRAAEMSAFNAGSPQIQNSLGYTQASTGPLGLSMAQPYLDRSGQNATDVSAYLNPYNDQVVRNLGDIGARTLREQLAPAIRDKFVQSGQLRASGQSVDEARALRDVYSDTLAKQAELLQQGYTSAQGAMQTDLARQGQLANTAGSLGFQQQGALSTAAGQFADAGRSLGQLTSADQTAQMNIGAQYGALTQAQQKILADIGTGRASASQADTQAAIQAAQAQAAAQLAAANQGTSAQQAQATGMGALTASQIAAQQAQAAQQAAIAQQQQTQTVTGANALNAAGALTQAQNQKSLDQQYNDFLNQQNYPQQQIDAAVKTFQGVQGGVPQGSVGYEQQVKSGQGPSAAATALGVVAAAKGVKVI